MEHFLTMHKANNADSATIPLYDRMVEYVEAVYIAARAGKTFRIDSGIEIIGQLTASDAMKRQMLIKALHQEDERHFIYTHPVNTAILSAVFAEKMGYGADHVQNIALAALFHDIGTVAIPEDVLNKPDAFSDSDYKIVKQRPNHSFEILEAFKKDFPFLAETAVQVYERIDGSGYPRRVKGEEINAYAQAVGIIDVYEALTHNRPHRDKLLHFTAGRDIIGLYKNRFHRGLMKSLLNTFSLFPVSSLVRLNSGAVGQVVDIYPDRPLRPKVKILFDSQKRKLLMERIVDLSENPLLQIVGAVTAHDIQSAAAQ